jgi:hypothetical protein
MSLVIITWCCTFTRVEEEKPIIASIESHSGFYFGEIGQVFFYPAQCKVVRYVNLKPTQMLWKQVKSQQSPTVNYCNKIHNATWYSLTDCRAFTLYTRSKVRYVEQLKDVITDYLFDQPERMKRGILEIGGDILKFLFGTLTQSDAVKYTQHI